MCYFLSFTVRVYYIYNLKLLNSVHKFLTVTMQYIYNICSLYLQ